MSDAANTFESVRVKKFLLCSVKIEIVDKWQWPAPSTSGAMINGFDAFPGLHSFSMECGGGIVDGGCEVMGVSKGGGCESETVCLPI